MQGLRRTPHEPFRTQGQPGQGGESCGGCPAGPAVLPIGKQAVTYAVKREATARARTWRATLPDGRDGGTTAIVYQSSATAAHSLVESRQHRNPCASKRARLPGTGSRENSSSSLSVSVLCRPMLRRSAHAVAATASR